MRMIILHILLYSFWKVATSNLIRQWFNEPPSWHSVWHISNAPPTSHNDLAAKRLTVDPQKGILNLVTFPINPCLQWGGLKLKGWWLLAVPVVLFEHHRMNHFVNLTQCHSYSIPVRSNEREYQKVCSLWLSCHTWQSVGKAAGLINTVWWIC